uniref:LAGLIDADG endonuclease n=1 Tax=Massjukichlorella minus TaxID=2650457 RepID=UPI0024115B41|nr:LAGLIDADG endonuclease [Massjukichlorella minus]WDY12957.1 LAGLIDADG endonuclease [Massjukichlorella minus]
MEKYSGLPENNEQKVDSSKSFPKGFSYYIAGFTDGEGSFSVSFRILKKLTLGIECVPSFAIGQKNGKKNVQLLEKIRDYLSCGSVRYSKGDNCYKYEIRSLSLIREKILPFFEKYPLLGEKATDFTIFCEICSLMAAQQHRNKKGLIRILKLAAKMNNASPKRKARLLDLQALLEKNDKEQIISTFPE